MPKKRTRRPRPVSPIKKRTLITPHHNKPCEMCRDDANKYNHCAFCGSTFNTWDDLSAHLDVCDWYAEVMGDGK